MPQDISTKGIPAHHDQQAIIPRDPCRLMHQMMRVGHYLQQMMHQHEIEAFIGKRQGAGIAYQGGIILSQGARRRPAHRMTNGAHIGQPRSHTELQAVRSEVRLAEWPQARTLCLP